MALHVDPRNVDTLGVSIARGVRETNNQRVDCFARIICSLIIQTLDARYRIQHSVWTFCVFRVRLLGGFIGFFIPFSDSEIKCKLSVILVKRQYIFRICKVWKFCKFWKSKVMMVSSLT